MAFVHEVKEAEFEQAVLQRSREVAVVVDFWAAWCAPCRSLGPILEREVEALGGRVELAKVDVEAAPGLGGRFKVQGIPAVMAFRDGEVVAEFVGARDASFVRQWLGALAPSPSQLALSAASTVEALERLIDDPEVGPEAVLRLVAAELQAGNVARAREFLERAPRRGPLAERTDALERQVTLASEAEQLGGEAGAQARLAQNPDDLEARYGLGAALAAKGDAAGALEAFLAVVTQSRKFKDDAGRKAMLVLFEKLGPQHELTRAFRRRLQVVL